MPGMNGSELATELIPHRPEMRVLFTSGYTEDVIVHHGVLNDDVSFLGKPYSPSALAKKIREVLDKA
jgi:Response regulator containing CheY-like receiver and SARP domains